mmetsp:Transcript_80945/g.112115  ORF Transcript_80945/g.112115 Transcript_80945/m.112115 type:complete len:96 (+) Transcript_80945:244-531(+)
MVIDGEITAGQGKDMYMTMIDSEDKLDPHELATKLGYIGGVKITDEMLETLVNETIEKNQKIVAKILKTGKSGPVMSLVGQVIKATDKKGDPQKI